MNPGPPMVLLALGLGVVGGYAFARLYGQEPPAVVECGGTGRMFKIQLSPALEGLLDRRRGDRWVVLEAREVPRPRPDGGVAAAGRGP